MISLKLCVLPGLFSLFFSIQTLNCQRQLQYSVGFTVYCRERKALSSEIQVALCQLFKGKGRKVFLQDHIYPHPVEHLCWFTVGTSAETHHSQTEFTSLESYSSERRVFLSSYIPSYSHPIDLSCSVLPPMFWKSPKDEFRTIWISNLIQIYLLLLTSVLILMRQTVLCNLEENQEKQGFDFQLI